MKGTCHKCGAPLKKGNIRVVRPRGKRRPWRECRRCPDPKVVRVNSLSEVDWNDPNQIVLIPGETAGEALQRPQDMTGGPVTVEGVFDYSEPPRYRFFMTKDQADRVKKSLEKTLLFKGFGIGFEVIPVPEDEVERDPETFADLVEVKVEWKGE